MSRPRAITRFSRIGLFVLAAPELFGSCGASSPPVEPPAPVPTVLVQPTPSAAAGVEPTPCEKAQKQRERVAGLLSHGKLDRAVRVIDFADRLCASSAGASDAERVTALAELGRDEDALQVAARIDDNPRATAAAKAAAEAARAGVKQSASAPRLDGEALYQAGIESKKAGRAAEAQRLFDRAMASIERAARAQPGMARARLFLDTPNLFVGNIAALTWARVGAKSYLAVANEERISVFDAETWLLRFDLRGEESIDSLVASPDGRTLAAGSYNALQIWDVETGREVWRRDETHNTAAWRRDETHSAAAAWSRDGKTLLVADRFEPRIEIWDAASKVLRQSILPTPASPPKIPRGKVGGGAPPDATPVHIESIAVSARGDTVAAGLNDGTVRIWKSAGGKEQRALRGHKSDVITVEFSANGKLLISEDSDSVHLWQVATGKELRTFPLRHSGHALFTPDQRAVVISTREGVIFWDVTTGTEIRRIEGVTPDAMAFDASGTRFALSEMYGEVIVLDAVNGGEIVRLDRHAQALRSVAWVPGASAFVTGSWDDTARIWDADKGSPTRTIKDVASVNAVAVSPDGQVFASGTTHSTTTLWSVPTGEKLDTWQGAGAWINALTFDPGGKILVSGSEGKVITLLDVRSRKVTTEIPVPDGAIKAVAMSPDGHFLAAGTQESSLHLWDAASLKDLGSVTNGNAVSSLMWSPDGKTLLAAGYEGVLYDTSFGTLKKERELAGPHDGCWVKSVAFRPDGKLIATGSSNGTIRLWDTATGGLIGELEGHEGRVESLAFRPDGKHLVSCSEDGTIRVWSVDEKRALLVLRAVENSSDAYAYTPGPEGRIEFFGQGGRAFPLCRIGAQSYRFELCQERFEVPGLGARVLSGDGAYLEP